LKPTILIRAYGSHLMGMGHLYRIRKLVEFLSRVIDAEITFLTQAFEESRDIYQCFDVDELYQMPKGISESKEIEYIEGNLKDTYTLIINDQLKSSEKIAEYLVTKANKVLAIDDTGLGAVHYHNLINVLYGNTPLLPREKNEFKYLILADYQEVKDRYQISKPVSSVFINQGAADTWGGIPDIIRDLESLPYKITLKVLLGPAYKHFSELTSVLANTTHRIELFNHTDDVLSIAAECDVAILGAGNTMFEALSIGMPVIACTREEKELITIRRLVDERLIHGKLALFHNYAISESLQRLEIDYDERKRLFELNRRVFSYRGLDLIIKEIEGML